MRSKAAGAPPEGGTKPSPAMSTVRPLPRGRIVLLLFAGLAALAGLNAALTRLGVAAPIDNHELGAVHGILMIYGFIGTAIMLERAVALQSHSAGGGSADLGSGQARRGASWQTRWGFAAPTLSGLATLMLLGQMVAGDQFALLGGAPRLAPGIAWTVAITLFLVIYLQIWQRQQSIALLVQILGAIAGLGGIFLWTSGYEVATIVPWWAAMLLLTIVGERMELARVAFADRATELRIFAECCLLLLTLVAVLLRPELGYFLLGLTLGGLVIDLTIHDVARRTIHTTGMTRLMAACMLTGYFWALIAAGIWLVGGPALSGYRYDIVVHTLTIGFVMSMIVAHAPVIVPAIVRRPVPYHRMLWAVWTCLQLGLVVRVIAGARNAETAWQFGGAISVLALVAFMVTIVTLANQHRFVRLRGRGDRERASSSDPGIQDERSLAGGNSGIAVRSATLPTSPGRGKASGSTRRPKSSDRTRGSRTSRTDRITTGWMLLALVATVAVPVVGAGRIPQSWWLTIHLLTLGVLTNGILQWSWYFARALLRLAPDDLRAGRDNTVRIVVFNIALVALIAGMWTATTWVTVSCAGVIGAVIAWHGYAMMQAARNQLGTRFRVVLRYYVAAAVFLVIGCVFAGLITVAMFDGNAPAWIVERRDELTLAHSLVNVGGWVGLSIAGTLVTLGPSMLRTAIDPAAIRTATFSLGWLVAAVAAMTAGATAGWMPVVGLGLLVFAAVALLGIGVPLLVIGVRKVLLSYPSWTMASGCLWVTIALVIIAFGALHWEDPGTFRAANMNWIILLGIGGVAQIFIGALSFLMPVAIGGGPRPVREGIAVLEWAGPARVALRNTALVVFALSIGQVATVPRLAGAIIALCYAMDIVLLARAGIAQVRQRRTVPAVVANDTRVFVSLSAPPLTTTPPAGSATLPADPAPSSTTPPTEAGE